VWQEERWPRLGDLEGRGRQKGRGSDGLGVVDRGRQEGSASDGQQGGDRGETELDGGPRSEVRGRVEGAMDVGLV
jgi:hypothetical protein